MHSIRHVGDVARWRLCVGCGACAEACPSTRIRLFDVVEEGIRPAVGAGDCGDCSACLSVCPAVHTTFPEPVNAKDPTQTELSNRQRHWGPMLEVWEGYATDSTIRHRGSSGGILTALALYALEGAGWSGVLHTAQDPEEPVRNRTRLSQTRADIVEAYGSRYSPGSVCNGLVLVENAPGLCAVIGQPSEIAGVARSAAARPALAAKIGVTLSFFCAGSPPTAGTLALLRRMGIEPSALSDLRYRGNGWPGCFVPRVNGAEAARMSYRESWAFLQAYRPWSVQMWPDGTGELADLSCGDAWYRGTDSENPGLSLVIVRTERGRAFLRDAVTAGYVRLAPAAAWKLEQSQQGLRHKKASIWGRRLALRLAGLPVTSFTGLRLFACWVELRWVDQLRSILGTLRRVSRRRLFRPAALDFESASVVRPAVVAAELRRLRPADAVADMAASHAAHSSSAAR